jgi:hypothetical protein
MTSAGRGRGAGQSRTGGTPSQSTPLGHGWNRTFWYRRGVVPRRLADLPARQRARPPGWPRSRSSPCWRPSRSALPCCRCCWLCGFYRKLPLAGSQPRPVRLSHRLIGFGSFALTVPIAVHFLLAYGVQLTSVRVAVHSVAGCFFYGAFVAKVLLVQSRRLPGWVLPVAGGTLAVVVGVLWYTSALWYYNGFQLPAL